MSAALAMMITEAIASAAKTSTRVKPSRPERAPRPSIIISWFPKPYRFGHDDLARGPRHACDHPKCRPVRLVLRAERGCGCSVDAPMQSARFAFLRSAGRTGTVEWSIEQRAQKNLGRHAALGIGHDAACLRQVWADRACKNQKPPQSDERFKQRKSRLTLASFLMAPS